MKLFYAVAIASLIATNAYATMPVLTSSPIPATPMACEKWAAEQDEDAIDMWGVQDDGTSSKAVALHRLADSCMGRGQPEIVGFGSSVGFDLAYCKKHKTPKICKK